jgi:radical SAM protein with 4Fe4S-binding SPASM domain
MQPRGVGVLQIEPTDHCNLSCTMCAPHHERWEQVHRVAKGYLDPHLWRETLHSFVEDDLSFDHIIFQWLGDPSLHPELPTLIADAARILTGRVGYLRLDTNAILLTPDRIDALLDALSALPDPPTLLVVFTIDAQTAPTYADVKGRDALPRVRRHVRHLIRRRRQRGAACRVNLQLQFVVQPGNAAEAGPFLTYWSDLLACQGGPWHDEIMFKRLSVGGGAAGQADADNLYEQTIQAAGITAGAHGAAQVLTWEKRPWQHDDGHAGPRSACPALWLTPVIRHDGQLMMCCADLGGQLALGSLRDKRFKELWWGRQASATREEHLQGKFNGVCESCGGINWYTLTPEMVAQARKHADEIEIVNSD